ncbi:MAG: hypothetical protein JW771_06425 [Candidatus Thermoplasmatota archaeon]|nr:hypothetical protein [Candidatus Thermoplasmatota archaeon]
MEEGELSVESLEVVLNKRLLLAIFIVTGISIILAGCLVYLFSDALVTVFCSLVIGATIGVMVNYFLIVSKSVVKTISVELTKTQESTEELQTIMKIQ